MTVIDVMCEMTAVVWKLETSAGQTVAEGDIVMVLESMKMEIPIEAPSSGRITEMLAAEGDSVSEGDVLLRIEVGT
ncbi:MAG: acetyl-CoA carboxylase biotin carboxyl carrier protein subunit [Mesorhizobium sp.]|nr:acetyl-CoA carboxylase biotin carboxyl carrier protein subunit [Mesorhizobium sp.]